MEKNNNIKSPSICVWKYTLAIFIGTSLAVALCFFLSSWYEILPLGKFPMSLPVLSAFMALGFSLGYNNIVNSAIRIVTFIISAKILRLVVFMVVFILYAILHPDSKGGFAIEILAVFFTYIIVHVVYMWHLNYVAKRAVQTTDN